MRSIKLFASAAVLIGGLSFASCSSDDGDAVSSEGNPSAGTVTDSNGTKYRLTKAGNISYSYDSDGKLSSIYVNGETYNASFHRPNRNNCHRLAKELLRSSVTSFSRSFSARRVFITFSLRRMKRRTRGFSIS